MVLPNEVARRSALPMLDVYLPMMQGAAVLAAAELGVFVHLARGPRTASRLAIDLKADRHGIERLCEVLVGAGYLVRKRGGAYGNSAHTQCWFSPRGKVDYTAGLRWTQEAWHLVQDLGASIRRGGPKVPLWRRMAKQPALGQHFAAYMLAFAQHLSPQLVQRVPLPASARRLLDVGGSHGLHSIAFCRANPGLQAVVFDHAVSLAATERHIAAHGMQRRISTRIGDCVRGDLGRGFDVVLYFSVAHNQSAANNARVLRKCARALNPGGMLVIQDYVRGVVPDQYGAAFDLTLLHEVGFRTWRLAQFRSWLQKAGLRRARHLRLDPPEMGSLIVARKPRRVR